MTQIEPAGVEPTGSEMALSLARDQLSEQLSGVDSDDVKTLGYLGVDVAAALGVVAVHGQLNRFWGAYVVGFAVAALLAIVAIQRHVFYSGPDPLEVYFDVSPSPRLDVVNALVAARDEVKTPRSATHLSTRDRGLLPGAPALTRTGLAPAGLIQLAGRTMGKG